MSHHGSRKIEKLIKSTTYIKNFKTLIGGPAVRFSIEQDFSVKTNSKVDVDSEISITKVGKLTC